MVGKTIFTIFDIKMCHHISTVFYLCKLANYHNSTNYIIFLFVKIVLKAQNLAFYLE